MFDTARLVLVLRNDVSEIARMSDAVEKFCQVHRVSAKIAFNLGVVLEEVVVNVIHYAFPTAGAYLIHVYLKFDGLHVRGEVRDTWKAFDPLLLSPPRRDVELEHRAVGGLGIHLLKTLMDEVAYKRKNGQNCLQFAKRIEPEHAVDA